MGDRLLHRRLDLAERLALVERRARRVGEGPQLRLVRIEEGNALVELGDGGRHLGAGGIHGCRRGGSFSTPTMFALPALVT